MLQNQTDFLAGRVYAIKARLAKAQRRIERAPEGQESVVEQERSKRLAKVLELHLTNPEEAILLYNKAKAYDLLKMLKEQKEDLFNQPI